MQDNFLKYYLQKAENNFYDYKTKTYYPLFCYLNELLKDNLKKYLPIFEPIFSLKEQYQMDKLFYTSSSFLTKYYGLCKDKQSANFQALKILSIFSKIARDIFAIPSIQGEEGENFVLLTVLPNIKGVILVKACIIKNDRGYAFKVTYDETIIHVIYMLGMDYNFLIIHPKIIPVFAIIRLDNHFEVDLFINEIIDYLTQNNLTYKTFKEKPKENEISFIPMIIEIGKIAVKKNSFPLYINKQVNYINDLSTLKNLVDNMNINIYNQRLKKQIEIIKENELEINECDNCCKKEDNKTIIKLLDQIHEAHCPICNNKVKKVMIITRLEWE